MTLYVYSVETGEVAAKIDGKTNAICEALAEQHGYTDESYGWMYSPAFGCYDGLRETKETLELYGNKK